MDEELKQYLGAMEGRLSRTLDARLATMETRFDAMGTRIGTVETRIVALDTKIDSVETRLIAHVSEQCEKVETKLLTEFYKWGRTADMRTRQTIADTGLLGEPMLNVEDRVTALERERHKR
jgi:hypothetical protein